VIAVFVQVGDVHIGSFSSARLRTGQAARWLSRRERALCSITRSYART
jgi:hypothetical protein